MEADMSRFDKPSKKEQFALSVRQNVLGFNIINIIGALLTQNQQGFVGVILVLSGLLAIQNAFNKKLNVTSLNKGHAMINFLVGATTTYIGAMLIYTTMIGG